MTTSNLSDELSELDFACDTFTAQESFGSPVTRSCVQVESAGCEPVTLLIRKGVSSPYQEQRSSRLQQIPMGREVESKMRELVDKQQTLIDCLKRENLENVQIGEKRKKEHDAIKAKFTEFVAELVKALCVNPVL